MVRLQVHQVKKPPGVQREHPFSHTEYFSAHLCGRQNSVFLRGKGKFGLNGSHLHQCHKVSQHLKMHTWGSASMQDQARLTLRCLSILWESADPPVTMARIRNAGQHASVYFMYARPYAHQHTVHTLISAEVPLHSHPRVAAPSCFYEDVYKSAPFESASFDGDFFGSASFCRPFF